MPAPIVIPSFLATPGRSLGVEPGTCFWKKGHLMRYLTIAAILAVVVTGAALAAGPYRYGAFAGAASSSATALASLLFMQRGVRRSGHRARQAMRTALLVVGVMFVARVLVVAAATFAVAVAGSSVVAFVIAFFVPYFAFAAIEGAYVHSLARARVFI